MKHGFSLLEVLIASALASLLTGTLFFSYTQVNKIVGFVTDATDLYESALLIEQQLTKDVAGAFIPVQAIAPKEEQKKPPQKQDQKDQTDQKKGAAQPEAEPEKKKKKVNLLKDPFVCKNEGDNFSLFSFITANPMRVYWGKKTGEPKPSIARVVYTLEAEKTGDKKNPRFTLYRQEYKELELSKYTKGDEIEKYAIAEHITACSLEFIVAVEKEQEEAKEGEQAQQQKESAKEIEIKTFNDWHLKEGEKEKDVRSRLKLPDEVHMEITIADALKDRTHDFIFSVRLAADFQEPPIIKQQPKKPEPKKDQQGGNQKDAGTPMQQRQVLVQGANAIVENLRAMYRT